jgi:hypothetical protein
MIVGKVLDANWYAKLQEWHTWFAWRPVVLSDGRIAWFHRIQRRWQHDDGNWAGDNSHWEYAEFRP